MDILDEDSPGRNVPEFSVGEIAGVVKRLIEGELGYVRVRGEVGRVVRARSGHLYFDLKDERNVLSAMTWKGQVAGLDVIPEEGMEVIAEGKMTASGFQSKFSLNAVRVRVAGEGALMAMLEKRKKALAAEGLFDDARKQPLPYLPEVIGVVTSLQGAVIRDILHRLRDRFPRKVLVWPVAVQGSACAPEVTRAIAGFNALTPGGALPRPDLLIVARGGGSIEDLWGFNEESVARAAAASEIPLISAVGHETDTTLIDFVSDRRAPTPTAAAEMAVPVRLDLLGWVDGQGARLTTALTQGLSRRGERLRDLSRALPRIEALLESPRQRLDRVADRLPAALQAGVAHRRVVLERQAGRAQISTLKQRVQQESRALDSLSARLAPALTRAVDTKRQKLASLRLSARPLAQETARQRRDLQRLSQRFAEAGDRQMRVLRDRLDAVDRLRETLSYKATLERGYAVVRDGAGGVVTTKQAAESASGLEIEFTDGRVKLGGGKPGSKSSKSKPPEQGSLF
ncbi:exodeoxyribonuclease VII large subunit [Primorskyibacter sp. S187A]|uniref:exodeoxyribonuclease VII large subunit n=1 Tax=Primorskyibacter sp. S187A TaxID=3415130 RepID=UPI003C7C710E